MMGMIPNRKESHLGTSLAVQWLRLHTSKAVDTGSISGLGTNPPCGQK